MHLGEKTKPDPPFFEELAIFLSEILTELSAESSALNHIESKLFEEDLDAEEEKGSLNSGLCDESKDTMGKIKELLREVSMVTKSLEKRLIGESN